MIPVQSLLVRSLLGLSLAGTAIAAAIPLPTSAQAHCVPAFGQHKATKTTYWVGHSGGYVYRWTGSDLTAMRSTRARRVYSVARALKQEFGKPADSGFTYYEVTFAPKSIVGSLLSYERDSYWEGGAHPSGSESFVTVDVNAPNRPVKLTDLFPAQEIRGALLADRLVAHVLAREKIAAPATLDGLVKALADKEFGGEGDSMYSFPAELLEDFVFHHVEGGNVAVRLLLPHGSEINRFHHTQLGLLLPIPARLKSAFAQAAAGKSGAMMQTLQQIAGDRHGTLILLEQNADVH